MNQATVTLFQSTPKLPALCENQHGRCEEPSFTLVREEFKPDEWDLLVSEAIHAHEQGRGFGVRAALCNPGCGRRRVVRVSLEHGAPGVSLARLRCLACGIPHDVPISTADLN